MDHFGSGTHRPHPKAHKTRMCHAWVSGACLKGPYCAFAHGEHELRPSHPSPPPPKCLAPEPPAAAEPSCRMWLPPGADGAADQRVFAEEMDPSFRVPTRLANKSAQLVNAVNDFHYAMVNDVARNEFYRSALERVLTPGSRVLEIGTGSGLLAMLAASIGCEWVVAVEANRHMADLALQNIKANNLTHKIRVLNRLSTEVKPSDLPAQPNILLSELFGTLLLGESALEYIHDARTRLLALGAKVVPPRGRQLAHLIECASLESVTSVTEWGGFNLRALNALQDTATVVFTKQYGFQFSAIPHTRMAPPISILDIDFETAGPDDLPSGQRFEVVAERSGTIHAVLLTWEVFAHGDPLSMSTDPCETTFQRDMQWGQALQLIEDPDAGDGAAPVPFTVQKGDQILVVVRYAEDRIVMQFDLHHHRNPR